MWLLSFLKCWFCCFRLFDLCWSLLHSGGLYYLELIIPRLHLPRSSYDLFVYDFLYVFFVIEGGYKLWRMCLHCLRHLTISFGDKLGQNLTETLRISYDNRKVIVNHSVIFTTSLYKSHDARTMTLSQGVCNCRVLMCMDLNGYPSHKSCYEEASVFS